MMARLVALSSVFVLMFSTGVQSLSAADATQLKSPDGKIVVEFKLDAEGSPKYNVRLNDQVVLKESRLGLAREDETFLIELKLVSQSAQKRSTILTKFSPPSGGRITTTPTARYSTWKQKAAKSWT